MKYAKNICRRCGSVVERSDVDGYPFVCKECDENMFAMETCEAMDIETPLGTLRCTVWNDNSEYKEFAIDLIRPDGGIVQCAVIGTNGCELSIYAFDGNDECPVWDGKVDTDGGCIYY